MSWLESFNPQLFLGLVLAVVALLALGMLSLGAWTNRVERRRVRRYVESLGGTVVSMERTNLLMLDTYTLQPLERPPWYRDRTTPRFEVRWIDADGCQRVDAFVTEFYRNEVWAERASAHAELPQPLEKANRRILTRASRRQGDLRVVGVIVSAMFLLVLYLFYVYFSGRSFGTVELVLGAAVVILFVVLRSLMGAYR